MEFHFFEHSSCHEQLLTSIYSKQAAFVIAHRLSTVHKADKIIVIDKGEVRESGTHEELLLLENGIYHNLSALQIEVMG